MIVDHLYIDPGSYTGWTGIVQGDLHACGLARSKDHYAGLPRARYSITVELPVIYPHGKQKASPKSILRLAARMGEIVSLAKLDRSVKVREYEPRQWKGQVPKDLVEDRVVDALSPAERSIVLSCISKVPGSYQNNISDSLGLWLFCSNRL